MSDETDETASSSVDSSDQASADSGSTSGSSDNTSQSATASDSAATDGGTSTSDQSPADSSASPDTSAGEDPGQPYLFVDLYSGDDGRLIGKSPNWQVLGSTKGYFGAILKAWDGIQFNDRGWFQRHWPAVREAGGDRYGQSWFRGAYLFLEFLRDGAQQADAYLKAVESAGDWSEGDILPIIDVELGGEGRPAADGKAAVAPHPNRSASKQQIIDCVTACANRIKDQKGRRVILYGRGAMRDLGINDRMGCDLVWNPAYTATMVTHGLEAWSLEEIVLWQYCGDGSAAISKLPHSVPGFGACDLSVFIKGAHRPTLQLLRDNLLK
jgi:lysozyme